MVKVIKQNPVSKRDGVKNIYMYSLSMRYNY